jgi:ankyrin repeat protein
MVELQHHCSDLVKSADEHGNTPLHLACMNGYVEAAKLLMKMDGADIGAR